MIFDWVFDFIVKHFSTKEPDLQHLISFGDYQTDSQLSTVYWKVARYYYFLLLSRFTQAMDVMHWQNDAYINVSSELNEVFHKIVYGLEVIEDRNDEILRIEGRNKGEKVPGLVGVTWQPFKTLYQDQDDLRSNWKIIRSDVFNTLTLLEKTYSKFNSNMHAYEIPQDMQKVFDNFDQLLSDFKSSLLQYKVRVRPFSWDEVTGVFEIRKIKISFDSDSQRKHLFGKLLDNLGKEVPLSVFAESKQAQAQIRPVFNQIRDRFIDQGLGEIVRIEPTGNAGYKLEISQA